MSDPPVAAQPQAPSDAIMEVVDPTTGQIARVPETVAWQSVLTGQSGLAPGTNVRVQSPTGEFGTIPAEDLKNALAEGYKPAHSAQVEAANKGEFYNTGTQGLGAYAAGHMRGLVPFGLSDVAMSALGDDATKQALRDWKEYRPGMSLGGEVGGMLLGTAATAGLGGAGAGAKAAPGVLGAGQRLVGATNIVGNIAERKLGEALIGRGMSQAGSRVLSRVAGEGVQGAMQGLGNAISESAIQDHPLAAEQWLSSIGSGALLGGAIGGSVGTLGYAGEKIAGAAGQRIRAALGKVKLPASIEDAQELLATKYAEAAGVAANRDPASLKQLLRDRSFRESALADPDAVLSKSGRDLADALDTMHDADTAMRAATWGKGKRTQIRGIIANSEDNALDEAMATIDALDKEFAPMQGKDKAHIYQSQSKIKAMRAHLADSYDELTEIRSRYKPGERLSQEDAGAVFSRLDMVKQRLGKISAPDRMLGGEQLVEQKARDLYATLRVALEDESKWGGAAAAQKQINAAKANGIGLADEVNSRFGTSTGRKDPVDDWLTQHKMRADALQQVIAADGTNAATIPMQVIQDRAAFAKAEMQAYLKHYNLTPEMQKWAKRTIEAAENVESTLAKSREKFAAIRALRDWDTAVHIPGVAQAPTIGAIIAGAPGAAAGVAVQAAGQAIARPADVVRRLAFVERVAANQSKALTTTAKGLLTIGSRAAVGLGEATGVASRATKSMTTRLGSTPEKRRENYQKRIEGLQALATNPDGARQAVAGLSQHAPSIAANAQASLTRQAQYLIATAPKGPPRPSQPGLDRPPDDAAIQKWAKRLDVVQNPKHALTAIRNGTADAVQIDALRQAWPAMYAQLMREVDSQIADETAKNKPIPPGAERMVQLLRGAPDKLSTNIYAPAKPNGSIGRATPAQIASRSRGLATEADRTAEGIQS